MSGQNAKMAKLQFGTARFEGREGTCYGGEKEEEGQKGKREGNV